MDFMGGFLNFVSPSKDEEGNRSRKLKKILKNFYNHPLNQWILEDSFLARVLKSFLVNLDQQTINFLCRTKDLVLLKTNGKLSCTLTSQTNAHVIVVFPELYKLLTSCSPNHGLAILAHELGHIIQEHSNRTLGPLQAQMEADNYAAKLGFQEELISILKDFEDIPECKTRLDKLNQAV